MLFKMSDKKTAEPTVDFASPQQQQPCGGGNAPGKRGLTKKHVVIGAIALLVTGLAITGILVGIKIYTDSNLEIAKYTLQVNGMSQNVTIDNNNAITYHIQKPGLEAWILQDFDKGIQVTKQIIDGSTNCYVTALNRSIATDASSIPDTTPNTDGATSTQALYAVLPDPIVDLTFLGNKASAMCQNIPTYHAVPDCAGTSGQSSSDVQMDNSTTATSHRRKRTPAFCATCNQVNCLCICGCCAIVCADYSQGGTVCTWYYNAATKQWICNYYYRKLYAVYTMAYPTCTYGGNKYLP